MASPIRNKNILFVDMGNSKPLTHHIEDPWDILPQSRHFPPPPEEACHFRDASSQYHPNPSLNHYCRQSREDHAIARLGQTPLYLLGQPQNIVSDRTLDSALRDTDWRLPACMHCRGDLGHGRRGREALCGTEILVVAQQACQCRMQDGIAQLSA